MSSLKQLRASGCERARKPNHHNFVDIFGLSRALVRFALNPFVLEPELAIEGDSARIVCLHLELESQQAASLEAGQHILQHRGSIAAPVKLWRHCEWPDMHDMARPAGQTRGLAKPNHRALDLVNEKIAVLEEIPENSAEALRIDTIEGQESLDELVGVYGKDCRLISGAGDPQHGRPLALAVKFAIKEYLMRDFSGCTSPRGKEK